MTELCFITTEDGYSWVSDCGTLLHSCVEITSENFDLFPLDKYLDAIDDSLEALNYHNVIGFAGQIADGMKLVGVDEKTIKKMFYDWIIDRGLCIGLDK